jgi:predicted small lipoprotein YifL
MTKLFPRILCSAPVLRGACIAAVLACMVGCGQKGALYLPSDPAAANRATLDQVLVPFRGPGPAPSIPTPLTSTQPTQEPPPPTREGADKSGTGTGTASPVERP